MSTITKGIRIETRLKLVEYHLSAENLHNVAAIMQTFGRKPTFVLNGIPLVGHESICALYEGFGFGERGSFSDLHGDVKHRYANDEAVILELFLSGRHTGGWQGIAATHREFKIPACTIFTFDDEDRLASERVYFDGALLLRQLGVIL